MPSPFRRTKLLVPAVASVLLLALWLFWVDSNREPARWYMPGPLGHEPGATPPPPGPRAFLTRYLYHVDNMDRGEWANANQLTPSLPFSHNLSAVVPASLYDMHPELFPWVGGERHRPEGSGYYWNPDLGSPALADRAAHLAAEHFRKHPDAISFALGTNDALWFGESKETLQWVYPPRYFRQRPDYSDLVFQFMNSVATRLSRDWPQKHVGALAYYWSENVPSFAVHPNVLPFLTADRSQGYDPGFREQEARLQRAWAKAGPKRIGIYDYIYGTGFVVPRYHPTLLAAHLKQARGFGFTDYFAELGPNWGLDGPQPWLVAQLLQDPEQDASTLLDEYFRRFFRASGPAMRQFFSRCERVWMEQEGPAYWLKHYRDESQLTLYPPAVRAELSELLERAKLAASGDAIAEARVAWVADTWKLSELLCAMHESRVALARAVLQRGPREGVESLLSRYVSAREAAVAYDAWLREQRPGAVTRHYSIADLTIHDPRPLAAAYLADISGRSGRATVERLQGAGWRGPREPGRRIAGLQYGIEKAAGWRARAEPWEGLTETWTETAEGPVVRLENHKLTDLWQWLSVRPGEKLRFSVDMRGRSSGTVVQAVTIRWHDAENKTAGAAQELRLPPGDWPEWVTLAGDFTAPPNAVWMSVTFWLGHQQPGDWVEWRGVSVKGRVLPEGG